METFLNQGVVNLVVVYSIWIVPHPPTWFMVAYERGGERKNAMADVLTSVADGFQRGIKINDQRLEELKSFKLSRISHH